MPTLVFETRLPCSQLQLWEFHSSVEALHKLTPPGAKVEVLGKDLAVREGALHVIRVRQFGIPMEWRVRLSQVDPPSGFVDTAEKSPFKEWRHHHQFLADSESSILKDTITYTLPFGQLGNIADALLVRHMISTMFAFRHEQTRLALTGK